MRAHIRDIVINYEIEGPPGAPVVTLSHCLAATLDAWEFQVSALSGAYRVLRYDTRGHGDSSATPGAYTMEMLNDDLMGLLDYLNIRRTHFVGISMGGMIGQVFAINHPDRLAKLVLCDTTCRVPAKMSPVWEERIRIAETKGMKALADETLERWLSEEFRKKRPEVARTYSRNDNPYPCARLCRMLAGHKRVRCFIGAFEDIRANPDHDWRE